MFNRFILTATAVTWALCATQATGQQSSIPLEDAASKRRAEQDAGARSLIEAEKKRPRLAGYWQVATPIAVLTATDGKTPPLNAAGRKLYEQRRAAKKSGPNPDPMDTCTPPGSPRAMIVNQPFLLTQTPKKVTFFMQTRHVIRHVYLDGPLKAPTGDGRMSLWEGTSSGFWDEGTLVVQTGDFNGVQWLDDSGLPQSPDMLVTERFKRIDASIMEAVISFEDPKYYARPWSARVVFRALPATTLLVEEQCAEKLLEVPLVEYAPPKP